MVDTILTMFIDYLKNEKIMAANSLKAYERDVKEFGIFLDARGKGSYKDISNPDVVAYLLSLKNNGRTRATMNRKLASIKSFCGYMYNKKIIAENPTFNIQAPKVAKKDIDFLSVEEVEVLLQQPDDSVKGLRDQAILEVLYGTGLRVSELCDMDIKEINLSIGYVTCPGTHGKARIIPLGKYAKEALQNYLKNGRDALVAGYRGRVVTDILEEDKDALFVNYYGKRISRQGLWKIIKQYTNKAGIEKVITPKILRNSFAVHMLNNGADIKSLQELMGHEDISTTQVYLDVTKNKIKEVYDHAHPRA